MDGPERTRSETLASPSSAARPAPTSARRAYGFAYGVAFTGLLAGFAARHQGWTDGSIALGDSVLAIGASAAAVLLLLACRRLAARSASVLPALTAVRTASAESGHGDL